MKKHPLMITAAALTVTMVLGTGYAKKPVVETFETVTSQASVEGTAKASETAAKARETTEQAVEAKEIYHMLQSTATKTAADDPVSTPQTGDGRDYDIGQSDIQDVEVEIEEDVQITITYIEEPLGNLEDMTLVIALPEQEEWSILTEKGITVANVMSNFTIRADDGQELGFLKDNCPIEEGALVDDSGDKVTVACANSQGVDYPMEIKRTKQTGCYRSFAKNPCRVGVFPIQSDIE